MSYITTFTGKHFDPELLEKDSEMIDILDIAHALSLLCRGNGHVRQFYSVGQHCINCALEAKARGYSVRVVLGCLLHDAGEAYMSDVPRPYKHTMKEYQKEEDHLLDVIYQKYLGTTLNEEEKDLVKLVDDDMLYYDLAELMGTILDRPAPELLTKLDYRVVAFEQVEQQYLELFRRFIAC